MTQHEFWVLSGMLAALLAFSAGYLTGFLRSYRRGLLRGMSSKQAEWEAWLDRQEPRLQYQENYDGRHRG